MEYLFVAVPASILLGMFIWECVSRYYLGKIKKAQEVLEQSYKDKDFDLSVRKSRVFVGGVWECWKTVATFLAYKQGDKWVGLVNYEQYKELEDKFNLLTEHLKLEYVEQKATTEPPKFQKIK
jgi:hypothetical protein